MKYIIGDLGNSELTTALVFHEGVEHTAIAPAFIPGSITSAGFCKINVNTKTQEVEVSVYGESTGLGLSPNPERDVKIIKRAIVIQTF